MGWDVDYWAGTLTIGLGHSKTSTIYCHKRVWDIPPRVTCGRYGRLRISVGHDSGRDFTVDQQLIWYRPELDQYIDLVPRNQISIYIPFMNCTIPMHPIYDIIRCAQIRSNTLRQRRTQSVYNSQNICIGMCFK